MALVAEDEVGDMSHRACLIARPIDVEHRDRTGEWPGGDMVLLDVVSVDELAGSAAVYEGLQTATDGGVCSLQLDLQLEGVFARDLCDNELSWDPTAFFPCEPAHRGVCRLGEHGGSRDPGGGFPLSLHCWGRRWRRLCVFNLRLGSRGDVIWYILYS
jgi:hypothetical protein